MNRILILILALVLLAAAILLAALNSRRPDRSAKAAAPPAAAVAAPEPPPPQPAGQVTPATLPARPALTPAPAPAQPPAANTPAPARPAAATPATSATPGGDLIELDLKLPRWLPGGTPPPIKYNLYDPPRVLAPILVPRDVRLLSRKAPVTASDREPIIGALEMLTDGDKEGTDGSFMELAPGPQWVQIDLGAPRSIFLVALWHYHAQMRVYYDVVVQCADDPDFVTGVRTLFNNDADNSAGLGAGRDREYLEDFKGKVFDFSRADGGQPLRTRYLRFTSNGNTSNEMNHYIEIEVYGR